MIQHSIVDNEMTADELLASILTELDGYVDKKWKPERVEITKSRVTHLAYKIRDLR